MSIYTYLALCWALTFIFKTEWHTWGVLGKKEKIIIKEVSKNIKTNIWWLVDWQPGLLTLSNHFLYFRAVGHLRTIILRENTEACLAGATALPWRTVWLWGCTSESWWRSLNKNPLLLWNIHFPPDRFRLIEWKLKHPAHHAKAFRKMNVTNGSLKKPESRGTQIILASIIFSLFQIQSLQIDERAASISVSLHQPRAAWLTARSAVQMHGRTEGRKDRRKTALSLFLLKRWHAHPPGEALIGQDVDYLANFILLY